MMYNLMTRELAVARISDLYREAEARRLATRARRVRREAMADDLGIATPTHSAKSAVGWWLVGTGLRLAAGGR